MDLDGVKAFLGNDWLRVQQCIREELQSGIDLLNSTNDSILSSSGKQLRPVLALLAARAAMAAKVRMALAVPLLLLFMAVMTIITILNLTILPIDDCGCFGEAIKLSNTETFLKNLLLLGCALFLLLYPKGDCAKHISRKRICE